ncbi:MAG: lipopolysaccharide heptosyltransferase II [Candidatus Thioglobus sp.]|nr:lipopolysaccharide heptosyltransferase II [Candidatus Thioglobus sp.]
MIMKILIEVPTWLGDCVMASPAVENIIKANPQAKISIFGSAVSVAIFANHPSVEKIIIDKSKAKSRYFWRYFWLYNQAKNLKFDAVFSFRRQFSSKFFAYFINTSKRYHYQRYGKKSAHQVLRYCEFINQSLGVNFKAGRLKIYQKSKTNKPEKTNKKILGINPGASYGSAKRWYPQEFANVAGELSAEYDIVIFGAETEKNIAADIEAFLLEKGVQNYQNLAGKTSLPELLEKISQLDLFITGDSGPMHLAAAFQIPTVAIFGPTNDLETSPWMNAKSVIVKEDLSCQPCMQRVCPLSGKRQHQCMKNINAQKVLTAADLLI